MDGQKKILLIDDSEVIRKLYKDKLEAEGYLVELASDGEEGWQKMTSFAPDLVLLDMFMPKLTGFDFIEKLKQNPMLKNTPIIAFSEVQVDQEDLIKKGVKHVVVKSQAAPHDVKELIDKAIL